MPRATTIDPPRQAATRGQRLIALPFVAAIFLSSCLMFVVEPMAARTILPLLGGSPMVWNTCVLFFQAVLLVGYLYAHQFLRWAYTPRRAALHLVFLASPFVAALPFVWPAQP